MSLGPNTENEKIEMSRFDRINNAVKKAAQGYFEKPIHSLLFIFLPTTLIVLLFNHKITWEFYVILTSLAGIEIYKYFYGKQ